MADQFKNLPDIATIQPDRLIKYRLSEDRFSAEVLLPGLWYTDFDKKIGGKVTLWAVAKIFESLRYNVLDQGFGHFDKLKDDNHSIFMASTSYHLTQKMNKLIAKTHWGMNFPLHAKLKVIYAGTSSFTFVIELHDFITGEFLMSATLTFVYVDFRTRKPVAFPAWYTEAKQKSSHHFGPPLDRLPSRAIPEHALRYGTRASYSNIDFNGHVNQSIFVMWCTDAGAEAALKGKYSGFKEDLGKYPIKKVDLKYIGEGLVGDDFVVHTWQDTNDYKVVHFVITRARKVTFVAMFTFYSLIIPSNL